jgi:hypothetical protein
VDAAVRYDRDGRVYILLFRNALYTTTELAKLALIPQTMQQCDTTVMGDYILLIRNALYVPSLDHNLLPPFMMREAGVIAKGTPKIHLDDPSEDHALTFPETCFRIPPSSWGVLPYFRTTKPTKDDLVEPDEAYLLTPTRWNPHTDAYAKNEEAMMDDEGNVKPPREREIRIVLDDVPEDEAIISSLWVVPVTGPALMF